MRPLIGEQITQNLAADTATRYELARLSENQYQAALTDESINTHEFIPYDEREFIARAPKVMHVIRDIDSWAPQRVASHVHFYPARVGYEGGAYDIRGDGGDRIRINGPAPTGELERVRGVSVSLRRGAYPASITLYYPIHPPLSRLIPQPFVLNLAMHRLLQRGPVAGVDGVSALAIKNRPAFIESIRRLFLTNRVFPKPLRQHLIPKANGKVRELAIPCARDHLIQAAIFEVVSPYAETYFLPSSFGFRPGKSTVAAIRAFQDYLNDGHRWVVLLDLKDFFDSIPFPLLRRVLKNHLDDWLLVSWIMAQAKAKLVRAEDKVLVVRERGVPQGSPLSPLLGNMVLHEFDVWAARKNYRMIRFADDITFTARKKRSAEKIFGEACDFLETQLGLVVNREKSGIYDAHTQATRSQAITVLGFDVHGGVIRPSAENIAFCKESLLEILESGQPDATKAELFYRTARSWSQYFRTAHHTEAVDELERWTQGQLEQSAKRKAPSAKKNNLTTAQSIRDSAVEG